MLSIDVPTGPVMSRIDGGGLPAGPAAESEAVVMASQPRSSSIFFLCTARSALQERGAERCVRAGKKEELLHLQLKQSQVWWIVVGKWGGKSMASPVERVHTHAVQPVAI